MRDPDENLLENILVFENIYYSLVRRGGEIGLD